MVLLQGVLNGYDANGRIRTEVVSPFNGRYKVKLLNFVMYWSITNPNIPLRLNSQSLQGNFPGAQLILGSNTQLLGTVNTDFSFICDKVNGNIDLELTHIDGTIPTGFHLSIINFDFEKIDEKL